MFKDKLIVALDFDNLHTANDIVSQLGDLVTWFKIGGQLFSATGPASVETFRDLGKEIFLDLKFHDIPNTVAGAVAAAAKTGANMINMHASGGLEMMRAASEAANTQASELEMPRPLLLGVTVLTSIDEGSFQRDFDTKRKLRDQVAYLAELSQKAGLDGVVASPLEIEVVRRVCGKRFLIVTPGVRPRWATAGDQRRVTTPAEAIEAGADHIVVGRPITGADNLREAAENILQEIRDCRDSYSGSGANDASRSLTYLRIGARRNTDRGEADVSPTRKSRTPRQELSPECAAPLSASSRGV